MKLLYLWVLLIVLNAISLVSRGQTRATPSDVTNAFSKMFPNATNVQWRDKITNFAAFFDMKGVKCEAKFNTDGSWISTEQAIQLDSIPLPVTDSLKTGKYAAWKENSAYILKVAGGMTQYHIVVTNNEAARKILFFNQNGELLANH